MKRMYERVCGIDVHRDTVKVCVRLPEHADGEPGIVKTFGTKTADLLRLRDWLHSLGVTHAAMEATGVFWKPVYFILETDMTVLLVNPRDVQQVPGRKTDANDAIWIAQLLQCGLLRGSFVPPQEIRDLRDLTRYHKALVQERTAEIQRLHAVLQDAGIKLSSVVSDIQGMSCQAILAKLVEGIRDPEVLAELACGKLRKKKPLLKQALEGRFREHHAYLVQQMVSRIDALEEQLGELAQRIDEKMQPFTRERERLQTIPGVKKGVSATMIAEMGVKMEVFPSAAHLASWAGLCPGNRQSGGRRKVQHVRKGNRYLKQQLTQSAWAAVREGDNYLAAQYHRIVPRRGKKRAIMAVAHSIAVIAYHMLKEGKDYSDLGADYFLKLNQDAITKRCLRQLHEVGWEVTLTRVA